MNPAYERWLADRRAEMSWHSDGRCYITFRREPDGLAVSVSGRDYDTALDAALKLECRAIAAAAGKP